jgi:hypothetical protein
MTGALYVEVRRNQRKESSILGRALRSCWEDLCGEMCPRVVATYKLQVRAACKASQKTRRLRNVRHGVELTAVQSALAA